MKTIVIDARTIDSSTGHYTQYLLHHLNASYAKKYRFIVLTPSKTVAKWYERYEKLDIQSADEKSYSVREQTSLIARLESHRPDLVHFTMPQQPFLWIGPSVTTIHDLTLVRYDNIDMNRLIYKMKKGVFISLIRTVIMRSKAIITPTQFVKNDIVEYMGEKYADKIHVTLEAGEIIGAEPEPIKALAGKQFLTFVGNAFPYKNVRRTIIAYAKLKKKYPDLHLALGGKKDFFYEEHEAYVKKHKIPDVHFLGYISDGEKRWLLQNCLAYVAASLSEGFNMPITEAMNEGAPVIASNASCHPEVAGDAALYFDPHSTEELVACVEELMHNRKLRDELIIKGKEHVSGFSWKRMADQTVAAYEFALKRSEK